MSNQSRPSGNTLPWVVTVLALLLLVAAGYVVFDMGIPALSGGQQPTFEAGQRNTLVAPPRVSGADAVATQGLPTVTPRPGATAVSQANNAGFSDATAAVQANNAGQQSSPLSTPGSFDMPDNFEIQLPALGEVPADVTPSTPNINRDASLPPQDAQTLAAAVSNTQSYDTLTVNYNFSMQASDANENAEAYTSGVLTFDTSGIADQITNIAMESNSEYGLILNTDQQIITVDWIIKDNVVYFRGEDSASGQTVPWIQLPLETLIDGTLVPGAGAQLPNDLSDLGGLNELQGGTGGALAPFIESFNFGQYVYTSNQGRTNDGLVHFQSEIDVYDFVASDTFVSLLTTVNMLGGGAVVGAGDVQQIQQQFPLIARDLVFEVNRYVDPTEQQIRRMDLVVTTNVPMQNQTSADVVINLVFEFSNFGMPVNITPPANAVPIEGLNQGNLEGLLAP